MTLCSGWSIRYDIVHMFVQQSYVRGWTPKVDGPSHRLHTSCPLILYSRLYESTVSTVAFIIAFNTAFDPVPWSETYSLDLHSRYSSPGHQVTKDSVKESHGQRSINQGSVQ